MITEPLLLTVEEAARKCGLGKTKMYQEVLCGRCESVTIGRARRVPVDAIRAYVEQLREEARQEAAASLPHLDAAAASRT